MNQSVTQASARVRFELDNRADNVALVRSGLSALGGFAGFDSELITDLRTAVSEACNNVVVHAYEGGRGPMIVTIEVIGAGAEVVVRDHGTGIRQITQAGRHMGLGLGVMSALADRVEFITPPDGGTEVRMGFRLLDMDTAGIETDGADAEAQLHDWLPATRTMVSGETVIWLEPVALIAPVFGRFLRSSAAAMWFTADSVDRLHAVAAALADYAAAEATPVKGAVGIAIAAAPRRLELVSGPFRTNGETERHDAEWSGLAALVRDLAETRIDGHNTISFVLSDEQLPTD